MKGALSLTLERIRLRVASPSALKLTVDEMIGIRDMVASQMGESSGLEKIRHATFVKTLEAIGHPSPDLSDELYDVYMEARFAGTKPFSEVLEALKSLKARFQIGIISNGNSYPAKVGFPEIFDFAVFADQCGAAKPDSRIFRYTLSKIAHKPEEVLHVGDSLRNDVWGAKNCGFRTAWLNRERKPNPTDIVPDIEVVDLQELVDALLPDASTQSSS